MNICQGIPSMQAHRTEDDLVAGLCEGCIDILTSTKSWGSAAPNVSKNQGKGEGIVINFAKHHEPQPRMKNGGRPPKKIASNTARWRNYPSG